MKKSNKRHLSYLILFIVGISIISIVNLCFGIVIVEGHSMNPTLEEGQVLIKNKVTNSFERGDIVVFDITYNERISSCLTKRVIAVAGDTVEIKEGVLYLNGIVVHEDYIYEAMSEDTTYAKTTIEEGHVFVMGDNRNHSNDSRYFGSIDINDIEGKIVYIFG